MFDRQTYFEESCGADLQKIGRGDRADAVCGVESRRVLLRWAWCEREGFDDAAAGLSGAIPGPWSRSVERPVSALDLRVQAKALPLLPWSRWRSPMSASTLCTLAP